MFQVTADLGLVGVFSRACDSVGARLERGPSERNPVKQCALSWLGGPESCMHTSSAWARSLGFAAAFAASAFAGVGQGEGDSHL